jgi:membrane fusion protein (multidrug efflux system)
VQRDGRGDAQIYILKQDGTLDLRPVHAGRTLDNRQVIEEGLKPGEQVVVEGFQKIRPGAAFTGAPWRPASAAGADERRG